MQPPDISTPRWSPDGMYWWDGTRWIPASQLPVPAPPPVPPSYYMVPPPASPGWAPSPGLRMFLIVFLAIDAVLFGLLTLFGTIGEIQLITEREADPGPLVLWVIFVNVFALAVGALIGVLKRTSWARWVALAAGIVVSMTCLGLVVGIPIIVSAARAPLGKPTAS